jgi:hypothetical protein
MNASATAVQHWYKSNMQRIVEEKGRRDMAKLLHDRNLEEIAVAASRVRAALELQRSARCAVAHHTLRAQLLYNIRYEALAASRDAAWVKLKGFLLIIRAKNAAACKRKQRQLLLLQNDPDKASRVISRAVRRRAGQLLRLRWLAVGRFALATLRLQQKRKGGGFDVPKMAAVSRSEEAGQEDNAPMSVDALEDALMQMELTLRSQDEHRHPTGPDDNFLKFTQDANSSNVVAAATPRASSTQVLTAQAQQQAPPRYPADSRKVAPVPRFQMKGRAAASVSLSDTRASAGSKPSLSLPASTGHTAPKTTRARCSAMPLSLPVGSVVFSVRQLSEHSTHIKSSKPSVSSLSNSRVHQHRRAFAQVSELFSSSPSRTSSSAVALMEAEIARQSALNAVQSAHSHSNAPPAPSQTGYELEDDGDEMSGQLPVGVLEALMVRPTKVVEEDKRLLKLALDAENK